MNPLSPLRNNAVLILLLCCFQLTRAQIIPYAGSNAAVDTVCPFDDAVLLHTAKGWTAYQTLDNTYNGPVDSSWCISLKANDAWPDFSFAPTAFDTSRSIFIRADLNDSNKIALEADKVYGIYTSMIGYAENADYSTACPELICSGVIIGVEIPDSTFTTTTKRWHFINGSAFEYQFCLPSEKFSEQYLTDFIFKLTFNNISDSIRSYGEPSMSETYDVTLITDLTHSPGTYVAGEYSINGYDILPTGIGLLKYDLPDYPSTDHFYYVDVSPEPNPSEPVVINININASQTLLTQPYVQLRGDFAEGDTVRHTVNLINNGGKFCLSVIEMIFSGNTNYIFNKGEFEMYSPQACVMFKNGAGLHIADSATLQYGKFGVGVLGLGSGGTIVIGKNATLNIGNRVSIIKDVSMGYPRDVYMNLNVGSTLVFSEGASVTNDDKNSSGAHLCIYMNGGDLDMSALSAESRALIRLIYPSGTDNFSDRLNIYPNPSTEKFTAEIQSEKNCSAVLTLSDINGQAIKSWQVELNAGMNAIPVPLAGIEKGVHVFSVQCDNSVATKKVVIQ